MTNAQKTFVVGLIVVVLPLLIGVPLYVSKSNKEVRVRNQITAQQEVLASHYDKMWKTLSQKAQVSSEYKDAFAEIYPDLIAGRYEKDGGAKMFLAKVVKEDNPEFDTDLYKDLSRSIESQRTSYHHEQSALLDLKREHDDILDTFPGSVLLSDREKIKVNIITSTRTDNAFETGKDDNVELSF